MSVERRALHGTLKLMHYPKVHEFDVACYGGIHSGKSAQSGTQKASPT